MWPPQGAANQSLSEPAEGRTGANSTRALRVPDGTSAAWYIITIIGVYGVIFLFQLASNILRRHEKALEDVYYSNLTSELTRKGLRSKVAKGSLLSLSDTAVSQPRQAGQEPKCENSRPHVGTQGSP